MGAEILPIGDYFCFSSLIVSLADVSSTEGFPMKKKNIKILKVQTTGWGDPHADNHHGLSSLSGSCQLLLQKLIDWRVIFSSQGAGIRWADFRC